MVKRIAIHEAGHVVAAHMLGLRVQHVVLNPGGEGSACTIDDPEDPESYAKYCLAGAIAVGLHDPSSTERGGMFSGTIRGFWAKT